MVKVGDKVQVLEGAAGTRNMKFIRYKTSIMEHGLLSEKFFIEPHPNGPMITIKKAGEQSVLASLPLHEFLGVGTVVEADLQAAKDAGKILTYETIGVSFKHSPRDKSILGNKSESGIAYLPYWAIELKEQELNYEIC